VTISLVSAPASVLADGEMVAIRLQLAGRSPEMDEGGEERVGCGFVEVG
jgi:hypothetical protein